MKKKVKEKTQLEVLIETRTDDLNAATDPSERKQITEDLVKLYEMQLKEAEVSKKDTDKIISYIRTGIDAGAVILPLVVYVVLYFVGLKFEETGHVTSTWLRNLIGKIKPTK